MSPLRDLLPGWFTPPREPPLLNPASTLGLAALQIALKELGKGEAGANNRGPDIIRYRRGIDDGAPWCADFVSYCFLIAAKNAGIELPFESSRSAKRLYKRIGTSGYFVPNPQPGDAVCWHRGVANAATGHIGIVSSIDLPHFETVEGNKGIFPSRVRQYEHEIGEGGLIGFSRPPL